MRSRDSRFFGTNQPLRGTDPGKSAMTPKSCTSRCLSGIDHQNLLVQCANALPVPYPRLRVGEGVSVQNAREQGASPSSECYLGLSAAKSKIKVDIQTSSRRSRGKSLTLEELL